MDYASVRQRLMRDEALRSRDEALRARIEARHPREETLLGRDNARLAALEKIVNNLARARGFPLTRGGPQVQGLE